MTEKQLLFAETIRERFLPLLTQVKREFDHSNFWTRKRVRELAEEAIDIQNPVFWISHRNSDVRAVLEDIDHRGRSDDTDAVAEMLVAPDDCDESDGRWA